MLTRHANEARELALLPQRLAGVSVGHDGTVHRWNPTTGKAEKKFFMGDQLDSIAISKDGTRMLVGQNVAEGLNPVTVRCTETGEILLALTGHEYSVESAAFSTSGKWLATAGRYHEVLLHNSVGELQARLRTGSRNESLAFSADERYLFTVIRDDQDGERHQFLARCALPSLEAVEEIPLPFSPRVFCLSEDSQRLLAANQDALTLIDPTSGHCFLAPTEVRGRIRCVALTADGRSLAAGCDNGLIFIWNQLAIDLQSQQLEPSQVINTGPDGVTSIAFDAGDDLLAIIGTEQPRSYYASRSHLPDGTSLILNRATATATCLHLLIHVSALDPANTSCNSGLPHGFHSANASYQPFLWLVCVPVAFRSNRCTSGVTCNHRAEILL